MIDALAGHGRVTAESRVADVGTGGTIAITDAVAHPCEWMRTEQAGTWLGFTPGR